MSNKINHRCIICGEGYYHCNDCSEMKSFVPWRKVACSTECYQVYLAYLDYRDNERDNKKFAEQIDWIKFDFRKLPENLYMAYTLGKEQDKSAEDL